MKRIILLAVLVIGCCAPIKAQTNVSAATSFTVFLTGASEVPPNNTWVTASASFELSGNHLTGHLAITALDSSLTGVGIHGPAQPGQNGNFIFDCDLSDYQVIVPNGGGGGIFYSAGFELTDEQVTDLQTGLWYLNIKTTAFPNGELRGQICPLTPDCDCDGDGVSDKNELCLNTLPGAAVDANGCSIEQLCPCNGPWKNHKEYFKSVQEQAFRFWRERRSSVHERNDIIKEAEKSNCGNPPPPPHPRLRGPFPGTPL